jgi:hypothetical protein
MYWTKTDKALKLEEHLKNESCCWDHLSPELKNEFTEVMGHNFLDERKKKYFPDCPEKGEYINELFSKELLNM